MTLVIDSNVVDAAVATVAHSVATPAGLDLVSRAAPSIVAAVRNPGGRLDLVCVTAPAISGAGAWFQTANGVWVPRSALEGNAAVTRLLGLLPTCATPFQLEPGTTPLRIGAAESAESPGGLAGGTVAWIVCEQPGTIYARPGFWQRLETGQWVNGVDLLRADDRADAVAVPAGPI